MHAVQWAVILCTGSSEERVCQYCLPPVCCLLSGHQLLSTDSALSWLLVRPTDNDGGLDRFLKTGYCMYCNEQMNCRCTSRACWPRHSQQHGRRHLLRQRWQPPSKYILSLLVQIRWKIYQLEQKRIWRKERAVN